MPYDNQFASKSAHADFVRNPDVQAFLEACDYLTPPSEDEVQRMADHYLPPPDMKDARLPKFVLAIDGSFHETSRDDQLPSTKFGFVKVGAVLFSLEEFSSLRQGRFVDPFRVARLKEQNTALTFVLPSANIRLKGKSNVRDSFRAALDRQFMSESTRFETVNFHSSLRSTLFHLAHLRPGDMESRDPFHLKLHKCPVCGKGPLTLEDIEEQQYCENCGAEIYPTDVLRIWEEVHDYQSNITAISRLMMILEHLIPIHYMRYIEKKALFTLSEMAFFIDGPLAIFGNAAWLHRAIMIYLDKLNGKLQRKNKRPMLMIGLQKSGQVVDHVQLLNKFLPRNVLFAIDDNYRYTHIYTNRSPSGQGFGFETYYGQDFIFKTPSGRTFVFALPYPFASKEPPGKDFRKEKVRWENYPQLADAIKLIEHLESDLYKNAVVPIALAHRYTAISLQPGGRVLDLLTKKVVR